MSMLAGKLAVVTGGTSGIGAEIARRLHAAGATTVVTGRNAERGGALVTELGANSHYCKHDVSEESSWQGVMQSVEKFGDLDVLVNCAGIMIPLDIEQTEYDLWLQTMSTNAGGCYLGSRQAIAIMKGHGKPSSIINVGSTTALKTAPWVFAYGASKAAILSMTRSMALHCAQSGYAIRCNAVLPAVVETPMLDPILDASEDREAALEQLKALHPIGRLISAEEVANTVRFLASDDASGITGAHICVDGGQTAG